MRIQAIPIKNRDGPWRNVDGSHTEDFPGEDTVDKLFTRAAKLYGDKMALGTRELLEIHEEKQPNGRIFEKVSYIVFVRIIKIFFNQKKFFLLE